MTTLFKRALDSLAQRMGYVPTHVHEAAKAKAEEEKQQLLTEKAEVERDLRHKNKNLAHANSMHAHMEGEIQFLRNLQLTRNQENNETDNAVNRLDGVTTKLVAIIRHTWPEIHLPDVVPPDVDGEAKTG